MTKTEQLAALGQSVWIDYIRRSFLVEGKLQHLIDRGLRGMTSNPTIFEKAIAHSTDYEKDLQKLARQRMGANAIFDALAIDDIQQGTDLFRPVYERTQGQDGYVSIEVNPQLAHDTNTTLSEARRLWKAVGRPNLMVKIPATKQGLAAIAAATAEGINVNITLIFSLERYAEVISAYLSGLEQRLGAGMAVDRIHSVASFFVSRVDTKVDKRLDTVITGGGPRAELAARLRGEAAVANARMAYHQFQEVFEGERFRELRARGANPQRPLWASTSTKDPTYSDIKYIQDLIYPHTVNTMPEETLEAFEDHGEVKVSDLNLDKVRFVLQSLEELGVSMAQVTQELEDEGVASFSKSFDSLINTIEEKSREVAPASTKAGDGPGTPAAVASEEESDLFGLSADLGYLQEKVNTTLDHLQAEEAITRIWELDHTVWKSDPEEISNRLGWLRIAKTMQGEAPRLVSFTQGIQASGYTQAVLLGMGGSSLAPDLFSRTFRSPDYKGLELRVLDSTDPAYILQTGQGLDPARTLFIVSTKSGGTEETLSFFKFYYNWTAAAVGQEQAGQHFIAITDPGSSLVELANRYQFREVFLNDPNIGGRYSALSFFGLVPAALVGVDVGRLLENAQQMARLCAGDTPPHQNPAAYLGAILGEAALAGRDKATFVLSPSIASFGEWVEQLIAESTGKEGKGILPVVGEPVGVPAAYGNDRLFIVIELPAENTPADLAPAIQNLQDTGFPVVHLQINDLYDLGGQFFLWEMATAITGAILGINPFDQPNVESAKKLAREMVTAYKQKGSLPEEPPVISGHGIAVYGAPRVQGLEAEWILPDDATPEVAMLQFLTQARAGDYIAIQAFLNPSQANLQALQELRTHLRDRYHLATTLGFGPRFLHSTGQLHKGDSGKGLFLQFTYEPREGVNIPDEAGAPKSSISFGILELAQALGDRQALLDADRRVLRLHLINDISGNLRRLKEAVG